MPRADEKCHITLNVLFTITSIFLDAGVASKDPGTLLLHLFVFLFSFSIFIQCFINGVIQTLTGCFKVGRPVRIVSKISSPVVLTLNRTLNTLKISVYH